MKKIIYLFVISIMIFTMSGCGKESQKNVLSKIDKQISKTNGYQLEGTMELVNNENTYNYDVTVSYKKSDNYRVSLRNKSNNHEQIILKNKDGVYVITPSLNKSFKFQSKWPYNNSQAYLPQSIISDIKNDSNSTMKKGNDNYIFNSKVNYKNNPSLSYQIVTFDKNYNLLSVIVYDNDDISKIKVYFDDIDMKAKFNEDYFELDENIQTFSDTETTFLNELDDAIYPMYLPENTYLENEKVVNLDNGSRIILTFSGDNPFMLIEQTSMPNNEMEIVPTSGDLDFIESTIAIVDDTSITWSSDGIDYYIVSSSLNQDDMIMVAKSIATMPVGK